jgi:Rrf2 family protein
MTITRKAEYAISALVGLAQLQAAGSAYASSSELAAGRGIPHNLIAQTVSLLRRNAWVETQRGAHGGVRLAADPRRITLRQVIEAVDGPVGITRCLTGEGACENFEHCRLRGIWQRAQQSMLDVLDGVTVADLADARRPRL